MQDVRWNMCVYALCAQKQHREEMHVCVEMRAVCAEKKKRDAMCVCIYERCVREGNVCEGNVYLRAVCVEWSI